RNKEKPPITSGRTLRDRGWVEARLAGGAKIGEIARECEVSTATVRSWLRRHRLELPSQRPTPKRLAEQYRALGSVNALAVDLAVAPETARRWLIDAGIELRPPGRPRGRRSIDVDVGDLRRRRAEGESLRTIAQAVGIDWRTV